MKLKSDRLYLAVMEKEDCVRVWEDYEYDFDAVTEPLNIGHSVTKAEEWFKEIQEKQGKEAVRLGVFLNNGDIIGDIALQGIDWKNRVCSIGAGISKIENRSQGYATEAVKVILDYGFSNLGLERITATVLEQNIGSSKSLIKNGFILEGTERKAENFAGKRWDRLNYGLLREEFLSK